MDLRAVSAVSPLRVPPLEWQVPLLRDGEKHSNLTTSLRTHPLHTCPRTSLAAPSKRETAKTSRPPKRVSKMPPGGTLVLFAPAQVVWDLRGPGRSRDSIYSCLPVLHPKAHVFFASLPLVYIPIHLVFLLSCSCELSFFFLSSFSIHSLFFSHYNQQASPLKTFSARRFLYCFILFVYCSLEDKNVNSFHSFRLRFLHFTDTPR